MEDKEKQEEYRKKQDSRILKGIEKDIGFLKGFLVLVMLVSVITLFSSLYVAFSISDSKKEAEEAKNKLKQSCVDNLIKSGLNEEEAIKKCEEQAGMLMQSEEK